MHIKTTAMFINSDNRVKIEGAKRKFTDNESDGDVI
jgi:hypothetical protein